MTPLTRTALIVATASDTLTLPESAIKVTQVVVGNGTASEGTALTVVSTAPAAGQVQFTGTPGGPSSTLTLEAAATADYLYFVTYEPIGAEGAA